mmetsp:Transcript_7387/g.26351  ORF Transcript_7387/g.26351 Transcript_7387/m.26351 type:complete len:226 (-) Transcript_7387:991-1668(-)
MLCQQVFKLPPLVQPAGEAHNARGAPLAPRGVDARGARRRSFGRGRAVVGLVDLAPLELDVLEFEEPVAVVIESVKLVEARLNVSDLALPELDQHGQGECRLCASLGIRRSVDLLQRKGQLATSELEEFLLSQRISVLRQHRVPQLQPMGLERDGRDGTEGVDAHKGAAEDESRSEEFGDVGRRHNITISHRSQRGGAPIHRSRQRHVLQGIEAHRASNRPRRQE